MVDDPSQNGGKILRIAALCLIGALAATLGMVGVAAAADPKPYPLTATSNGKSYKQLVTEYVKWTVANDGAKGCNGLPQPASPIVFLSSVGAKGKYTFSCSFPAGSKILMLGGFNMCWTDAKTSLADLPKQCSPSSLAFVTRARATIDGVPINVRQYLVTSSIVKARLPKGKTFGIKEPSTSFLVTGWFPLLRPLAPGQHTLRGIMDVKNYGTFDVTYRITITE